MTKNDIELLQSRLNSMIASREDDKSIYEVSVELDKLIVEFYKEGQIYKN